MRRAGRDGGEDRDGDIHLLDAAASGTDNTSDHQFSTLFAASSPSFAVASSASPLPPDFFGDMSLLSRDYDVAFSTSSSSASSTSNLGPDAHTALLGSSFGASSAFTPGGGCGAECYAALLQQLLYLHKCLPETARPSIDIILQAERDMRAHHARIFACRTCAANRSSLLLLVTVAERIVQMLDLIFERRSLLDNESSAARGAAARGGGGGSAYGLAGLASPGGEKHRTAGYSCPLPMQVGGVKVDRENKDPFLKQLLQLRLTRLAAVLRELQQASAARPSDCMYFASELFLGESLQRLEYLRGQIQIWE